MANPKIEVEIGATTDGLIRGIDGSILSLKELISEAKKIEIALESATDVKSITQYNNQLADLKAGMQRLKTNGIDPLTKATSTYNGVGIEFSRIIQDAPFGIIGVGNNITQLASSFQDLRANSTSTGAALKTALSSIISPANLLVLGISAVTTAFTLYQMGAFDSKEETKDLKTEVDTLKQSLDNMSKSLGSVDSARLKGNQSAEEELSKVNLLISVIDDETLSRERRISAFNELQKIQPAFFSGITAEEALINGLTKEYNALTTAIFAKASATAIEKKAGELAIKNIDLLERERQETDLQNNLLAKKAVLTSDISKIQSIIAKEFGKGSTSSAGFSEALVRNKAELALVNSELETLGSVSQLTNNALIDNGKSAELLKDAYKNTALELGGLLTVTKDVISETENLTRTFDNVPKFFNQALDRIQLDKFDLFTQKIEAPMTAESGKATTQGIIQIQPISNFTEQFQEQASGISTIANELVGVFSGLGNQIANSFNISNDALKGFVGTLLSNTPKIIQAITQQAAVKKAASKANVASNIEEGTSGAVVLAIEGAKGLGPVGLALLPVLIGGALALVSSAFGKGGKGGGGGSVGGGVSSQSFAGTGLNAMQSMNIGGEFTVKGSDLVFVLSQENKKRNKG